VFVCVAPARVCLCVAPARVCVCVCVCVAPARMCVCVCVSVCVIVGGGGGRGAYRDDRVCSVVRHVILTLCGVL
jgi:hypothetical protein